MLISGLMENAHPNGDEATNQQQIMLVVVVNRVGDEVLAI